MCHALWTLRLVNKPWGCCRPSSARLCRFERQISEGGSAREALNAAKMAEYVCSSMAPSAREILAASAGWVAVTLNVVPGLGAGYLYQRRWKAYWITSALATTWFVLGAVLGQGAEAGEDIQNQWIGLFGLVALAAGTAVEAGLAAKKSREQN